MIQRPQSIYLVLAAIAIASLGLIDMLWSSEAAQTLAWFSPALLVLGLLIVLGAVAAVFMYKDRKKQRRVVLTLQTLMIIFIAVLFTGLFLTDELFLQGTDGMDVGAILIVLLPVLTYVFLWLARRGIERDIKLIRSMDRLR